MKGKLKKHMDKLRDTREYSSSTHDVSVKYTNMTHIKLQELRDKHPNDAEFGSVVCEVFNLNKRNNGINI